MTTNKPHKKLDEQLECLRKKLLASQGELKQAEIDIITRQEQIKSIEALINQVDQIVDEYKDAYPGLKARQEDYQKDCDREKKCLENILTCEEKKMLCCIVNKEYNDIDQLEGKIEFYEEKLDGKCEGGKRKRREKWQKKLNKTKAKYEKWLDPIKSIENRFKQLDTLKKQIDAEHSAGNHAYAYFLLANLDSGFCKLVNSFPKVVEPNCIRNKIKQAWCKYKNADNSFNEIDAKIKSIEGNLKTTQDQHNSDEQALGATIKRRLSNLETEDCVPPASCKEIIKCPADDGSKGEYPKNKKDKTCTSNDDCDDSNKY